MHDNNVKLIKETSQLFGLTNGGFFFMSSQSNFMSGLFDIFFFVPLYCASNLGIVTKKPMESNTLSIEFNYKHIEMVQKRHETEKRHFLTCTCLNIKDCSLILRIVS